MNLNTITYLNILGQSPVNPWVKKYQGHKDGFLYCTDYLMENLRLSEEAKMEIKKAVGDLIMEAHGVK